MVKAQILATRPVVSDKGAGPLTLQKRNSAKKESSEASKVFTKRRRVQYMWNRHAGKVTELHLHGSLNH